MRVTIKYEGPFFHHDPRKTFRQNVREMLKGWVQAGQQEMAVRYNEGSSGRAPIKRLAPERVAGHVVGRVTSLGGHAWQMTGIVSVNNAGLSPAEGVSLMAAASQVERQTKGAQRTFRNMRRARAANMDELLKGLR